MPKKKKSLSQKKKTNRKPCKEEENPQISNTISAMAKSTHFPIPEDIIADVLVRLPVKSLLRFKSVSKPWRSVISSSHFIKRHLQHSMETHSDLHLIRQDSALWRLEFDSLHNAIPLDCSFKNKGNGPRIFNSCNGLLCISKSEKDVAMLNPLTRALHVVPSTPFEVIPDVEIHLSYSTLYGFGYDPVNDDYKVLRLVLAFDKHMDFYSEALLYSLKSNSWKKITDAPGSVSLLKDPVFSHGTAGCAVCVDGALFWGMNLKNFLYDHNLIVAFDFSDEKFLENVARPKFELKYFWINLAVLEGKLCVVCNHSRVQADIWVMKERRVNESWLKLFSVIQERPGFLSPLAYSRSRDKVLFEQDGESLVWYDLRRKSLKKLKIHGAPRSFGRVELCHGSLVSPAVGDERKILGRIT